MQSAIARFASLVLLYGASGCVTSPDIVDHSFAFDALRDSPGAEVLDYRYGRSKLPGASNPDYLRRQGRSVQRTGVTGPMRKGDFLYVKWRTLNDNQVHEETADLRGRFPWSIEDCTVYFRIDGPRLYVYLVTDRSRPADVPPNGPRKYHNLYVLTIYPDRPAWQTLNSLSCRPLAGEPGWSPY